MKRVFRNSLLVLLVGALAIPATVNAQEKGKDKKKDKEGEQIIITRTGDGDEKVVIELKGDDVLINGKPASEYKGENVKVRRAKIKDVWAFGGNNAFAPSIGESFNFFSMDSNRAMLGVTTEKSEKGAEIESVNENSAAAKAGLKKGDIIKTVDDTKIETPDDLSKAIRSKKPGDKVTVTYIRDKKEHKTTAELGKWEGARIFSTSPGQNFNFKMDDLALENFMPRLKEMEVHGYMSPARGPKLGISVQDTEEGKGVNVIDVDDEGSGYKSGIREGDVITEVDGKAVNSADEVARIIRQSREKTSVTFKITRNGKTQTLDVKIPRKLKKADL